MLNLLYDFIPIILFFISFKLYGIYVATVVGIGATALQLIINTIWKKYLDKKPLITLIIFLVFGGMTLYFHNPLFVKWKPTVIYWVFSIILFFSHFIGKKPLMQRMLEKMLENKEGIPSDVWRKLNAAWVVFFIVMGGLNLFVAYHFSTNAK
jgi:intracellular septation protein